MLVILRGELVISEEGDGVTCVDVELDTFGKVSTDISGSFQNSTGQNVTCEMPWRRRHQGRSPKR